MLETSMLINKIGIVIGSGAGQKMAVKQFKQTSCVNDGDELSIGSVCASAVEITLFDYDLAQAVYKGLYAHHIL